MKWLVSLIGAALVMVALRDLFHTLWHPTRHGGSEPPHDVSTVASGPSMSLHPSA